MPHPENVNRSLPPAWREAWERDRRPGATKLADPGPERRIARLLGGFIAAGLVFLVLPGTLVGVWNLLKISAAREGNAAQAVWIQAHGHAQLFGWVATFMIGICLYAVPKFRGGLVRSLPVAWLMLFGWTGATLARWASALWLWHWRTLLPLAAASQLLVALLLLWQVSGSGKSHQRPALWNILVVGGLLGFAATMALQLRALVQVQAAALPLIPAGANQWLLYAALWLFCFPVAWGFSTRFVPTFLGIDAARGKAAAAGIALLVASIFPAARSLTLAAVLAACYSLRIFEPAPRKPKTAGVDAAFPYFVRLAFGWLVVAALLQAAGGSPGLAGASRHAFTVGFLAMLIFSIAPRIVPSFVNSRELWSPRLMRWSLVLLMTGCTLRVSSEPLAYAGLAPFAWRVLPVSGLIELTAVLLFAINMGASLATPMPAWFFREQVKDSMPLYWYVTSYPATKRLLIEAGLRTLATVRDVPRSLTLREAADADGVNVEQVLEGLRRFFESRLARTLRKRGPG